MYLPLPAAFLVAFAFAFGALVGSFLNVVIARVPLGQSIVWPGSHCMTCGKAIPPFHNVPILSWWLLRGRCANCRAPFSIRYSLIELAYALVCAFAVSRHGLSVPALREVLLMGFLIPLTAMDLDWWLLPHALTRPGIVVGLAVAALQGTEPLLLHLLAAAIGYTALVLVGFVGERVFQREALGGGDPWLFALIGAFLGPRALLPVLLFASLQGSVIGVAMILSRRRREGRSASAAERAGTTAATAGDAPTAAPAEAPMPQSTPEPAPGEPGAETRPAAVSGPDHAPASQTPQAIVARGADEDDWVPAETAVPFGPFLALGAAEVLYFPAVARVLFPF